MQEPGSTKKHLAPLTSEADYQELEALALKNGWRIRLRDGRVINPDQEKRLSSAATTTPSSEPNVSVVNA